MTHRLPISTILCFLFVIPLEGSSISGKANVAHAANDAAIYRDKIAGKTFPAPVKPETRDQINLRFEPHVIVVLAGTTVLFPNSDVVRHNVFSPGPLLPFNLATSPVHTSRTKVFSKPGVVTWRCNIHAEMSANVVVMETPYFAISDAQGNDRIPNVPPDDVLKGWREPGKPTPQEIITVDSGDLQGVHFELKK